MHVDIFGNSFYVLEWLGDDLVPGKWVDREGV